MSKIKIFNIETHRDDRGCLSVIEDVPFEIQRVFWIYNVPGYAERAKHSHNLCEQILICVNGRVTVELTDCLYHLCLPYHSLYIPTKTKITLKNFSYDAVLLVLASEKYDPNDQIQ